MFSLFALCLLSVASLFALFAPADTNTITSREYAIPDVTKSSLLVTMPTAPAMENPYLKTPFKADPFVYEGADTMADMPNIQGVSGNTTYAMPATELLGDDEVVTFPRENLKMLEKLGEGQFGEVSGRLRR